MTAALGLLDMLQVEGIYFGAAPRRELSPSTPQLPSKIPQVPSNRDYKAPNRGTLGGLGLCRGLQAAVLGKRLWLWLGSGSGWDKARATDV